MKKFPTSLRSKREEMYFRNNNFQFKNIQHFLYDYRTEYDESYYDKIPDELLGIGLDIFWRNKLHEDKETDERKDKEHIGVDHLR